MRKINKLILSILIFISLQNSYAQTTGSYIPAMIQEQSNWCWAACGSMIYWAYHTGTISQCQFVTKSRDQENNTWFDCNSISNSSANPCTSPGTFNQPQDLYTCGGSIENVLDTYGIGSTGYSNAFSASTLTTAMSGKKICIARWGWNSGGGHVVVIYRYKSGNVYFNNPLSGSVIWSYNTFKTANGSGSWTHTLRMNNASVYGAAYARTANTGNNTDTKPGISTDAKPEINTDAKQEISAENSSNQLTLNLYPNPTIDNVTIMLNGQRTSTSKIIISNTVGKIVYQQEVDAKIQNIKINVSQWPKGMYIIKLNGTDIVKKMVVL